MKKIRIIRVAGGVVGAIALFVAFSFATNWLAPNSQLAQQINIPRLNAQFHGLMYIGHSFPSVTSNSVTVNVKYLSTNNPKTELYFLIDTKPIDWYDFKMGRSTARKTSTIMLNASGNVNYTINGLNPSTLYYIQLRMEAGNISITTAGSSSVFKTSTCPVAEAIPGATAITQTNAVLNGAYECALTATFEYGPTSSLGTIVPAITVSPYTSGKTSLMLSGLIPDSDYFYAVRTDNSTASSGLSPVAAFRTLAAEIKSVPAVAITRSGAVVNVGYSAGFSNIDFELGTTPSFGTTSAVLPVSSVGGTRVRPITGLRSNTVYFYRFVGTAFGGAKVNSATLMFKTLP